MSVTEARLPLLLNLLARQSPLNGAMLRSALGISQPTLSRLLATAGDRILRLGRTRGASYLLTRDIGRAGRDWPLYRIDANARPQHLGQLHALHGGRWFFEAAVASKVLPHDEFANGLFPDLPWFLQEQWPQGFLGRTFARRVAAEINAPPDLKLWQADDVLLALLRYGHDAPGDLVLGDEALARAQHDAWSPSNALKMADCAEAYAHLANAAVAGEVQGSSAAGEQPKFTAVLIIEAERWRSVIVKFSDRTDTPNGRRWGDLLFAEHLAADTLREAGWPATATRIVESDGRVFLEATRFDRTECNGRVGLISLRALDAAFVGLGSASWTILAEHLLDLGWLNAEDARLMQCFTAFGELIANTDMHFGNLSAFLGDTRPLKLAPIYDMLPMRYRPLESGEVVARDYQPALPNPNLRDVWIEAATLALRFWQRVADAPSVSEAFRKIAADNALQLQRLSVRV